MNISEKSKIVVRGWEDWSPTYREFIEMLGNVQIGANRVCDVTIDGETKTMIEWQMEWQDHLERLDQEMEEQVKRELGVTHWSN